MKKISLLLLAMFAVCFTGYSQQLIVEKGVQLKPGIYRTFEEFKTNNPSIPLNFEIEEIQPEKREWNNGNLSYSIIIDSKEGQQIGQVYGFSDGQGAYIAPERPVLTPETIFREVVLHSGKYSWFEGTHCNRSIPLYNDKMEIVGMSYLGGGKKISYHLLNIINGDVVHLDEESLKAVLAEYPDLEEEFLAERKGRPNYRYFALEVSKRSKQELKLALK